MANRFGSFSLKMLAGVLRRPLARKVWVPVVLAALGVLAGVLIARRTAAGRAALWKIYSTAARVAHGGKEISAVDLKEAEQRLRAQAGGGTSFPLPEARIVILKKDRQLRLYSGERVIKTYAITMGQFADAGPKERKGTGRTPEGTYFICTRNGRSRFHLFLGLNYPNTIGAERGLEKGLIDEGQIRAIKAAEEAGGRPPWDTALGGEIGIHGGGISPADWTLGCIAVENGDIEELWVATHMGTPVEILP